MEVRRTEELERAFDTYRHLPDLLSGFRHALGADEPDMPLDPAAHPVVAFLLSPGDPLFTAWFLTPGRFIVAETSKTGDSLTVAVPINRVARVSETDINGVLTVTVEIDADAMMLQQVPTAPGAGSAARLERAHYALSSAEPEARQAFYRFAATISRALGA